MMEFVSWDDDIPNIWGKKNVPNHHPVIHIPDIPFIFSIDCPIKTSIFSCFFQLTSLRTAPNDGEGSQEVHAGDPCGNGP